MFPGNGRGEKKGAHLHASTLAHVWADLRTAAKLEDVRLYDACRHSFASVAVSQHGLSLAQIGEQLQHSQPATTRTIRPPARRRRQAERERDRQHHCRGARQAEAARMTTKRKGPSRRLALGMTGGGLSADLAFVEWARGGRDPRTNRPSPGARGLYLRALTAVKPTALRDLTTITAEDDQKTSGVGGACTAYHPIGIRGPSRPAQQTITLGARVLVPATWREGRQLRKLGPSLGHGRTRRLRTRPRSCIPRPMNS